MLLSRRSPRACVGRLSCLIVLLLSVLVTVTLPNFAEAQGKAPAELKVAATTKPPKPPQTTETAQRLHQAA
jgi:hypothetical protein